MVAAHLLGVSKTTFYRKLKEMGEIAAWREHGCLQEQFVALTLADKLVLIAIEDGATV